MVGMVSQVAPPKSTEATEFIKLEKELNELLLDFNGQVMALEAMCGRAFGLSPNSANVDSKPAPVPNGMVETISQQIAYLRDIKNRQYDYISRLERLI